MHIYTKKSIIISILVSADTQYSVIKVPIGNPDYARRTAKDCIACVCVFPICLALRRLLSQSKT